MTERRIWFNALHSKAGGGLTYLFNMAPLLAADPRLDLTVIATPEQAVPGGIARLSPPEWARRLGFLASEQVWLPRAAREMGVDAVYSPANYGPLWGVSSVILLSNSIAVGKLERRWSKRAYWLAIGLATWASLKRSRRALAVSAAIREELAGRTGAEVTVIPHGVSRHFGPGTCPREDFILAVGDIYIQKNFQTLIETFARVRAVHPSYRLKIAGTVIDHEYKSALDGRVRELGLTDAVRFMGRCTADEIAALYRTCRVFAFPSLAESFGMPILEAMACGAPVVASDRSAMPEVAGGAAILADASDPAAFADAVLAVLDRPGLADEMSQSGIRHAARFTWEAAARRTADALIEAAAGS